MRASDPLAMELVRWIAAAALVAVLSAVIFLRTAKGRRPTPKRRARRDGPYTAGWMDEEERRRLFGGPSGLIVGQFPDRSEERRVGKEFVRTGRSRWSPDT